MPDILDDRTVPYAAKRSSKAKHIRLEVRVKTGLTVVIPGSYKIEEALTLSRIMGYLIRARSPCGNIVLWRG